MKVWVPVSWENVWTPFRWILGVYYRLAMTAERLFGKEEELWVCNLCQWRDGSEW